MLEIISSVIAYNELKYTPPQSMSNAQYYSAPLKLKADLILTSQNRYPTEHHTRLPGLCEWHYGAAATSFDRSINWLASRTVHSNTGIKHLPGSTSPRINSVLQCCRAIRQLLPSSDSSPKPAPRGQVRLQTCSMLEPVETWLLKKRKTIETWT